MSAKSWKRLDGVDLLRGLAIFFVLMNHVNMRLVLAKIPYTRGLPKQLVSSLVWNGQFGVQIFFVVSGFLITSTTLRRWGTLSRIDVPGFYRLRFARIAPLLLLLLAILSILHLAHVRNFAIKPATASLGRALFAALTFQVNVLEANHGYLPGSWDILWSLAVEEMFYLFFPLLCRGLGRGKLLIAVLCAFVVLAPFGRTVLTHGNEVWQEYSYLGSMDAIAMGCLTAIVASRKHWPANTIAAFTAAGATLVVFILCFSQVADSLGLDRSGLSMSILAAGTCLLIMAAAQTEWTSPRILRPLAQLGQRSYEVYLTHMFLVFVFFDWFVSAGKPMPLVPVLFVAVILAAALLGALVARFYSEPMNRLLRDERLQVRNSIENVTAL